MAWSNLYKRNNSKPNTSFTTNLQNQISNLLIIGRVTDILLNDSDPEKFKTFGEWNGIGTIEYETIDARNQKRGLARPLDTNYKKLPLINELIAIIPAYGVGLNENPYSITGFYLSPIGIWNHPHHNAFPDDPFSKYPIQDKTYLETELGSYSQISDTPVQINLGNTFKERSNIRPLQPFEGDIIVEGRWGNSIRLGSTVISANDWSTNGVGVNGDPIIILRNGQISSINEGYKSIIESTNNSFSSIYLTSTQNIPIDVASDDYRSYSKETSPTNPKNYSGAQAIINSGRLVFNSTNDHILLSSAKSINLNSVESVNIDTQKFITQADKIFLGKEDLAKEPLLLGNATVKVLKDLYNAIKMLNDTLNTLTSDPVVTGAPATFNTKLLIPTTQVSITLKGLEKVLGTTPEDCTLTSKNNFTR
tara:strand:+ start:85 stop:1347 length:1263 start_codon:yes stop_codon:yes gene_type:complete